MGATHTAQRIACLQPSATATLEAIGELDRMVACTRYCLDIVPAMTAHPPLILADSWSANAEQIIAAKPDLVIASVPYQEKAVVEILKAGIRFLGLAPKTLADIYTDIATIAGAVGNSDGGVGVIRAMQEHIDRVRRKVSDRPRLRVFCEEWGKPIIASQPWVAELIEAAGGVFVSNPGKAIDSDAVGRAHPDVLLAAWCGAGDRVPLEKIIDQRGWHAMPAVRQ